MPFIAQASLLLITWFLRILWIGLCEKKKKKKKEICSKLNYKKYSLSFLVFLLFTFRSKKQPDLQVNTGAFIGFFLLLCTADLCEQLLKCAKLKLQQLRCLKNHSDLPSFLKYWWHTIIVMVVGRQYRTFFYYNSVKLSFFSTFPTSFFQLKLKYKWKSHDWTTKLAVQLKNKTYKVSDN